MNILLNKPLARCFGFALALSVTAQWVQAADSQPAAEQKQRELIEVLRSTAPPGDKGIACKQLAIYGTDEAVPTLAALLPDKDLSSWARIALEAIPGPVADEALRQALERTQGRLEVGIINSIATRRDAKAVPALIARLADPDVEVGSAAAIALGCIGGDRAAKALKQALSKGPEPIRTFVAQGCIRCAESFLAAGKQSKATRLYDTVRAAHVPRQRVLEATRGSILARGQSGLPLLLIQLRSPDKALFGLGLRVARELPGAKTTRALAEEMWRTAPDRQEFLLLALSDRNQSEALPVVLDAANRGSAKLRLAAVRILDRYGNPSTAPALLAIAASDDADLASAALTALARMPGNDLDADLLNRLGQASGKMRQALVQLAGQRRIAASVPSLVQAAQDSDPGIRSAAVRALGAIGGVNQIADLGALLAKSSDATDRGALETALVSISGRAGTGSAPLLLPLAHSGEGSLRIIALHALVSAGGPEALGAVRAALTDTDESVQDEAVRTLSSWPNTWPEDAAVSDPLRELAQTSTKTSHQVLALRGYLQFLQVDKKLSADDRTARLKDLAPLLKRPEEKRLAVSVLHDIPGDQALELLTSFASDAAVADDACSVIVEVAAKKGATTSVDQRKKALEAVMSNSTRDGTKEKAEKALNALQ